MPPRKAYKVLVSGDRYYKDRDKVFHVLDALHARIGPDMMIITGGATGADEFARQWAVERRVDHLIMYAKWGVEGRGAGPIRNRRMAKKKPRLVCAFHPDLASSRGTADMIRVAEKMNVKVKRFK
jgi:hypothetical protein